MEKHLNNELILETVKPEIDTKLDKLSILVNRYKELNEKVDIVLEKIKSRKISKIK